MPPFPHWKLLSLFYVPFSEMFCFAERPGGSDEFQQR
jgi:hypothetical protein